MQLFQKFQSQNKKQTFLLFKGGGPRSGGRFLIQNMLMVFRYNKANVKYARINRKAQTEEEWKMRNMVLKMDKTWYRFLRQKPIWNYILDFYCDKLKLGIEIDDKSHDWKWEKDEERTEYLNSLWIKIIRYNNSDINYNLEWVIMDLNEKLIQRYNELKY